MSAVRWTPLSERWPDLDETVVLANERNWICADVYFIGPRDDASLTPLAVLAADEKNDHAELEVLLRRAFKPCGGAVRIDPDDIFGECVEPFFAFDLTRFTHWRPMPDLGMNSTEVA